MKKLVMIFAVLGLVLAATDVTLATTPMQAAKGGADYLLSQQLSDGGWAWTNGSTSAVNITGATGIGLVRYYNAAGGSTYLGAAKSAGNFILNSTYSNGESGFATFDPYYSWQLSLAAGDNTWTNHAATKFFDKLSAGTYGRNKNDNTAGWIGGVQAYRSGAWVNLRPWEFSTIAVTARNIGNAGQETLFRQGILDGLNTLDNTDPNVYEDLIGVAGGVRGLAMDAVTAFTAINSPNDAGINGISTLSGLADYLAGQQNADGSWYYQTGSTYEYTQTSAYAVLALEAAATALNTNVYNGEIASGRNWLVTMQDGVTGGFRSYSGDTGSINNEVSGEATAALAAPIPEPATLFLLGTGLLGLVGLARKKKRGAVI